MLLELAMICVGFVLLVKGAEYLVKGGSHIAQRFGVSYFVIGLTIVAFGTSMPEFVVNVHSAIRGTTDIAVGNILGSNMANMLLVIGLTAIIAPIEVNRYAKTRDIPMALFSAVILLVLSADAVLFGAGDNILARYDGVIMLVIFAVYMARVFTSTRNEMQDEEIFDEEIPLAKSLVYIAGGLVGLYYGGELIVDNAVLLAREYEISEILISSTIIAFGTSLPELATSLMAAVRGRCDIAVGNVIGSNIFNTFWVLGATCIIRPIHLAPSILGDIAIVGASTLLLLLLINSFGKREIIQKPTGMVLFSIYVLYIVMLVVRG